MLNCTILCLVNMPWGRYITIYSIQSGEQFKSRIFLKHLHKILKDFTTKITTQCNVLN